MRSVSWALSAIAVVLLAGWSAPVGAYEWPATPSSLTPCGKNTGWRNCFNGGNSFTQGSFEAAVRNANIARPAGAPAGKYAEEARKFLKGEEIPRLLANLTVNQECPPSRFGTLCGNALGGGNNWGRYFLPNRPQYFQKGLHVGVLQQATAFIPGFISQKVITADEANALFRGDLQAQVNIWLKTTVYGYGGLSFGGPVGIFKRYVAGHAMWKTGDKRSAPLDAAMVLACRQIGGGLCRSGGRDNKGKGIDVYAYANNIRNGRIPTTKTADGFTGCLKDTALPRPEFVGPPSPGSEATPDFTQTQPQLVLKSSMTGSEFATACKQQIDIDLQHFGVSRMTHPPVPGNVTITSRYGIIRKSYSKGKHVGYRAHAGFDISAKKIASTGNAGSSSAQSGGNLQLLSGRELLATNNGTVIKAGGGDTNAILIQREGTDHVFAYLHPFSVKVKNKQPVSGGDVVGFAGNYFTSQRNNIAVHLHYEYYIPEEQAGDKRKAVNVDDMGGLGRFPEIKTPLTSDLTSGSFGGSRETVKLYTGKKSVAVDPTPFMHANIEMDLEQTRGGELYGKDSYSQYCITRSVDGFAGEKLGGYASAQEYIEHGGACDNEGNTKGSNTGEWAQWLPDTDGWGEIDKWLDMSPNGQYDYRSYLERALDIARYRFSSTEWATKIMHLSSLKLWQDYLLARRTETWLDWQLHQKREHINHMLAVLIAQRGESASAQTKALTTLTNVRAGQ